MKIDIPDGCSLTLAGGPANPPNAPKDASGEEKIPAPTFSLSEALIWLKKGFRVRRRGWNGKGQYLRLATGISYRDPDGEVHDASHADMGSRAIVFYGTSGQQVGWLASQSDLLSEDWEVVR